MPAALNLSKQYSVSAFHKNGNYIFSRPRAPRSPCPPPGKVLTFRKSPPDISQEQSRGWRCGVCGVCGVRDELRGDPVKSRVTLVRNIRVKS